MVNVSQNIEEVIEIALPSDENYYPGLLATAGSIAVHANKDALLSFNILDGGIKDDTFKRFCAQISALNAKCRFRRLQIDLSLFEAFPLWSGSHMTYARLLLPILLPDNEFVIYSDTDYLWLIDILELWRQRDSNVIMQSCVDQYWGTIEKESAWFHKNGKKFCAGSYFGAGLSFYNLRMCRAENIVEKVYNFIKTEKDVQFADQTALNVLLYGRVRILPQKWTIISRLVRHEDIKSGCAIHFGGEIPWRKLIGKRATISDPVLLWHKWSAKLLGITTWQSLRMYYPVWTIILRRLVSLSLRVPILGSIMKKAVLLKRGNAVYRDFCAYNHVM